MRLIKSDPNLTSEPASSLVELKEISSEQLVRNSLSEPRRIDRDARSKSVIHSSAEVQLSVVIPCQNVGDPLAERVKEPQNAIDENYIDAEVIVADSGRTDGSCGRAAPIIGQCQQLAFESRRKSMRRERRQKSTNPYTNSAGPRGPAGILIWFDHGVKLLRRNAVAASIVVGIMALSLRLLLLLVIPPPEPAVHDEFSYLLAADTFAHGRLTNSTHPMWIHFETFHELSHPTYASKYPPGAGLVLALGEVVFHAPWAAVWISMAVLCGLITWTLWAWLPPPWAIAGGLLAVLQLTGSYWTESYWGGTLAAIGGALLIGALARLMRRPARAPAFAFGLGLAILANTRPYEGFILGVLCTVFLLTRMIALVREGHEKPAHLIRSIGLPLAAVLIPTLLWMGYYNYKVTGHPLLMPYQAYEEQYSSGLQFLWSNKVPPQHKYNHEVFRTFWLGWTSHNKQFAQQHIVKEHLLNLLVLYRVYLTLPLLLCLLYTSRRLLRNRNLRIPLVLLLLFYLGVSVVAILLPHYFAPATVLVFLIITAAVQEVSCRFAPGKARNLSTFVLFLCVALFELFRIMDPVALDAERHEFIAKRDRVLTFLQKQPGQQLVLVRYGPVHIVHEEWVYNDADIDQSRIVWARSMPKGEDEELLRYYPDRRVWILDDDGKITLRQMKSGAAAAVEKILIQPLDKYEDGSLRPTNQTR